MAFIYLAREQRHHVKNIIEKDGYIPIIAYEDLPLDGEKVDLIYVDSDCQARICKAHFESDGFGRKRFIGETEPVKGNIMGNCVAWRHISY